jgi:transcriptional regulator with XRE-family HTH domain
MSKISEILVKNIELRRKDMGVTKNQLAIAAEVSSANITHILNGDQENPSLDTIGKFAKALGCSVIDLLSDLDEAKPKPKSVVTLALENEQLRAEIATLQAELAQLKAQLASQASDGKPSPLAPDRKKARTLLEQSLSQAHDPKNKKDSK